MPQTKWFFSNVDCPILVFKGLDMYSLVSCRHKIIFSYGFCLRCPVQRTVRSEEFLGHITFLRSVVIWCTFWSSCCLEAVLPLYFARGLIVGRNSYVQIKFFLEHIRNVAVSLILAQWLRAPTIILRLKAVKSCRLPISLLVTVNELLSFQHRPGPLATSGLYHS